MVLSDKLLRIIRSKTELTEKEIENLTEQKGWEIVYSLTLKKEKLNEICFTGFSPSEKKELIQIAENNKFHVAKSVTTNLNFLCCGDNAGPSKMDKAEKQGAIILNKDDFFKLIQTGELPRI
ncbi:BRCT domain-containing protein [Flavobacterium columnare]|uniref:BRCT domain-containing protein n=1 Tax=Flavobacterium columnare TaxID=996 RepID=UPI003BA11D7D